MPFAVGHVGVQLLNEPVVLEPRYYKGIRIDRVKLYAGTRTIYLRPERGISMSLYSRTCHYCGVRWSITFKAPRDLLQCAVDGIDRFACWSCGDTTFLPPTEDYENYDVGWYTLDQ